MRVVKPGCPCRRHLCQIMQPLSLSKAPCEPNPNTDAENPNPNRYRKEYKDIRPVSKESNSRPAGQRDSAGQVLHKPIHIPQPPLQVHLFLACRPGFTILFVHIHRASTATVRVCAQM